MRANNNSQTDYEVLSEETNEIALTPTERPLLKVGITHGDTNGVGYELIFKTFADNGMFQLCIPVVYGATKVATNHRKQLNMNVPFRSINHASEALEGQLNLLNCFNEDVKVEFGTVDAEAGNAAFIALEKATEDLKNGIIDVLVTAPICKSSIQNAHFNFAGHTEYLQDRLGENEAEPLMILANDLMRVALVTTHLPISKIAETIQSDVIEQKLRIFYQSLRSDFLLSAPRIAVLGLNPHNGDNGVAGNEDKEVILPVVNKLMEEGIPCFGPYPADGFFGSGMYTHFDGILAMYHDQGLAPFKALTTEAGVNITAGLNFVRTSPDHGTAFDIAGKGEASESSFRQAIFTAIDIFHNRVADKLAKQDPLPKLYHEKREDGDRQRHTLPEKKEEQA